MPLNIGNIAQNNINFYDKNKRKNIETFGIGNTTNVNMDAENNRSFEQSLDLESSQVTNCISNFMNDVANNIDITNETMSSFASSASNRIIIDNLVGCDVINIGNINQTAINEAENDNSILSDKKVVVQMSVDNTIKTKIEKQENTGELIDQATKAQQTAMEAFLKGSEVDYDALGRMARNAARGASSIGIGNTSNVNVNFTQTTDVETALGISSKQINDVQNNTSNTLSNKIKTMSKSEMNTYIESKNLFVVKNVIDCRQLNINNISQTARIKSQIRNLVQDLVDLQVVSQFKTNVDNVFSSCWSDLKDKNTEEGFTNHNNGKTPDDSNYVTREEYAAGLDAIANNLEAVELQMYLSMLDNQTARSKTKDTGDLRRKIEDRLKAIADGDSTGCGGSERKTSTRCTSAAEIERQVNELRNETPPGPALPGPAPPGAPPSPPKSTFDYSSLLKPPYNYILMGVCVLIILLIILMSMGGGNKTPTYITAPPPVREPVYNEYDNYNEY